MAQKGHDIHNLPIDFDVPGMGRNMTQPEIVYGQIRRTESKIREAYMHKKGATGGGTAELVRCSWARNELAIRYHDLEWGVPVHDDRLLFEFLVLEGAQAGLSWDTILRKRENYRAAFDGFDPQVVARYDKRKVRSLLQNEGIVRNRLKIASAISNAQQTLAVASEFGTFDRYIWQFVGGSPRINAWKIPGKVPARTAQSDAMSKDLQKRGFRFVGSTICYAFMQAVGMVNDHLVTCFRYSTKQ
jgi:DNA-3-methyladenine glycosylase I